MKRKNAKRFDKRPGIRTLWRMKLMESGFSAADSHEGARSPSMETGRRIGAYSHVIASLIDSLGFNRTYDAGTQPDDTTEQPTQDPRWVNYPY
jgi:hypothetical protein